MRRVFFLHTLQNFVDVAFICPALYSSQIRKSSILNLGWVDVRHDIWFYHRDFSTQSEIATGFVRPLVPFLPLSNTG